MPRLGSLRVAGRGLVVELLLDELLPFLDELLLLPFLDELLLLFLDELLLLLDDFFLWATPAWAASLCTVCGLSGGSAWAEGPVISRASIASGSAV